MSNKTEQLVNALSELSVLEMSELKKALEEKWGVKAAAATMMAAPAAGGAAPAAAVEATDYEVILQEAPKDKTIAVIKAVRELTGLGLKEAKDLVDGAPKQIFATKPKADAEKAKKEIEAAGGKVTLKGL